MLFYIIILIKITQAKYSWTLDRINQYTFSPDFIIENYNNNERNIDVYIVDSGITKKKDFYDNIVEIKNFANDIDNDENGHGTFVTSLVSSKYYGVTNGVNIHSLKVFGKEGSTPTNIIYDSLIYIREKCKNAKNNCVINLSLGMDQKINQIDNLLKEMYNENILIVASAGNSDENCKDFSPANLEELLVVGSIDYMNYKSSFSNYGDCVDIYTYGELVPGLGILNGVNIMSGTSMSTPIITGYISNYWSINSNMTNKEVIKNFLNEYSYKFNHLNIFKIKTNFLNDIIFILIINISLLPFYIIFYILFKCK